MLSKLPRYDVINTAKRRTNTLVLVPVYNESPHLAHVLRTIRENWCGDLLAVDDNSTDHSPCMLKLFPDIHVIRNRQNCGAGGVLLQGFGYAEKHGYDAVITIDSDGQHLAVCIADFLRELDPNQMGNCGCFEEADFVWGSRYMRGHSRLGSSFQGRQEVNKIVTRKLNAVTGYRLTDAFCGYRAYRLSGLRKLNITETGYGMFMQLTVQAAKTGIGICEIPVPLIYIDETRNFNSQFQDTQKRLAYYINVIDREIKNPGR